MPNGIVPLTDAKVKNAKAQEKPTRLFDGGGPSLSVTPADGKVWGAHVPFREQRVAARSWGRIPRARLVRRGSSKRRPEGRSPNISTLRSCARR